MVKILNCCLYAKNSYGTLSKGAIFFGQPCTMLEKNRNTAIRESLNIESLLLQIERSQHRWLGHVIKTPRERLFKQT